MRPVFENSTVNSLVLSVVRAQNSVDNPRKKTVVIDQGMHSGLTMDLCARSTRKRLAAGLLLILPVSSSSLNNCVSNDINSEQKLPFFCHSYQKYFVTIPKPFVFFDTI